MPKIYGLRVHQTGNSNNQPGDESTKPLPTDSDEVRELKLRVKALMNEKLRWQTMAKELQGIVQRENVHGLLPKRKKRRIGESSSATGERIGMANRG